MMRDIAGREDVQQLIARELQADQGPGDATTLSLVDAGQRVTAMIQTRENCIVSGVGLAVEAFRVLDSQMKATILGSDGEQASAGDVLVRLEGSARAILTAERTALNLMQRMCGIATLTRQFVDAVAPLPVRILDTRKTTPGLRVVEKYAVTCGGGQNHRFGLYDKIMIKDNHRRFWQGGQGLGAAVLAARAAHPDLPVEIEVESRAELVDALTGNPDEILLDNMPLELMRECAALCKGRCVTEASGGITLENVRAVAETGVDAISLGCLTHAYRSVDLTLEMELL
ncbi:MAG: carboxylating nicotinate-nucleotide diphosphorylase [Kiritimatiellia bacterium]